MKIDDEKLNELRKKEKDIFKEIEEVRDVALKKILDHFNIDIGDKVEAPDGKIGFVSSIHWTSPRWDTLGFSCVGIKKNGEPSMNSAGIYCEFNQLKLIEKTTK